MSTLTRLEAIKELRRIKNQGFGQLYTGHNDDYIAVYRDDNKSLFLSYQSNEAEDEWKDKSLETAKDVLRVIKQYFDREPLVYVNAYAVHRIKVSSAEGGIWEDQGEPIASVPVIKKKDNVDRVMEILEESLGPEYEQPFGRDRFSVLGGPDLLITIEKSPAEPWPNQPYIYQ